MMQEAATIKFEDAETSDEGIAIVRYNEKCIALCLSLKADGDIEVVMKKSDAERLIEGLKRAMN